jgi:predicted NAD/FAD-dependent oxidoreductase
LQFEHGAQYLTAKTPAFAAVLAAMQAAVAAAPWADGSDQGPVVGLPGLSGIAKHLGQGLEVRQNA